MITILSARPKNTSLLARVRHIQANPHVCLVADRYDEDWRRLAWVQVRGTAELLNGGDRRDAALAALCDRYEQYRSMDLTDRPV
ncbi:MAG TPA: pyridoxamine 5'-phosphate oxidase family protein, partial [Chloroflexota bacterium]|nr:pyridoxamine 5'-phosphate oxidase family protein [Chloroflexota bacterium]